MTIAKNKDVRLLMFILGIIMLPFFILFLLLFLFFIALNIFMSMLKSEPPVINNSLKSEIIIKKPVAEYSYITTFDFNEDRSAIYYLVFNLSTKNLSLYKYDLENKTSEFLKGFYVADSYQSGDMAHGDDGKFYVPIMTKIDSYTGLASGVIVSYDVESKQEDKYNFIFKDCSNLVDDKNTSWEEEKRKVDRFKNSLCKEFLSDNNYEVELLAIGANRLALGYSAFPLSVLVGSDNSVILTSYCTKEELKKVKFTKKIKDFKNPNCDFSMDPVDYCKADAEVGVQVKEYSWADGLDGPYHEAYVLYYKGKDFEISSSGESLSGFFTDKYGDIVVKDIKGNIVKLSAE